MSYACVSCKLHCITLHRQLVLHPHICIAQRGGFHWRMTFLSRMCTPSHELICFGEGLRRSVATPNSFVLTNKIYLNQLICFPQTAYWLACCCAWQPTIQSTLYSFTWSCSDQHAYGQIILYPGLNDLHQVRFWSSFVPTLINVGSMNYNLESWAMRYIF